MAASADSYDADEVKARLEKLEDDEFKDAIENDGTEGISGDFTVTDDELNTLRTKLTTEYPEDASYFSDAYIRSVASKPYSKDPTQRRPLDYSQEKLTSVMQWRAESGAPALEDWVRLAAGSPNSAAAVEDPETYQKALLLVKSLNTGSLYWHGFTVDGRPILWIRTNRKAWYPDVDAEVNALILMSDVGIRCMPPGVTDFVVVAESSYPPPPNPTFMVNVLKAFVRGYPDRLNILYSAPVSSIVQFVMNLLLPLMPGALASKVCLYSVAEVQEKLVPQLAHANDLPVFLGGTFAHDDLYPDEGKCQVRGEGTLKFDYFGMVERLQKARDEYVASKPASSKK